MPPAEGPRHLIGIDLGTTNSALAWIDLAARPRRVNVLDIQQLVAPGERGRSATLPSFLYLPGEHELPAGALALPWQADARDVVGELARSQGAAVPGRLVSSAKSWLCHPAVDRRAGILPWAAPPEVERRSPIDVSARFLAHLMAALRAELPEMASTLEADEWIVTVPASFDEVARELTVEAARRAGLPRLTLLEEPQAAFYSWLVDHGERAAWEKAGLAGGEVLLVCDIGGGTTDFTLIEILHRGDEFRFQRTAVGDHLLLGGDNMDIAVARQVEKMLGAQAGRLDAARFQALVQACRVAKETLLAPGAGRDSWTLHVGGRGRSLIGGALQAELTRADIEAIVLDGFFPRVSADASPEKVKGAGLREFGLPYAQDAAVTRHLAAFLARHHARPNALLFNGGVVTAPAIRERILEVLESWFGRRPLLLENDVPHLAVARGAAYYGLARRGQGIRIAAGAARAYYVEVETDGDQGRAAEGRTTVLCLAGRGDEESGELEITGREFQLLTNRPVRFRFFSSSDRTDRRGDLLAVDVDALIELPPIVTVLRFARSSQDVTLGVRLHVQRTEIGTLDLHLVAPATGERWQLAFDLRGAERARERRDHDACADVVGGHPEPPPLEEPARAAAIAVVRRIFRPEEPEPIPPAQAMKELGRAIGRERGEWSTALLRSLWDPLRDLRGHRGRTADHEARWLNLVGYCLRPGYGFALDDWRVKEAWRLFNAGLVNDKDARVRLEGWILWRRISGGLTRTMQDELLKRIAPHFLGDKKKSGERKAPSAQEAAEMWRTLASLERISAAEKWRLGEALWARLEKQKPIDFGAWVIGRLGARVPLYGPIENVIPRHKVERWIERLLALDWSGAGVRDLAFALAEMARVSGDRSRDLDEPVRQRLAARLAQSEEGMRFARWLLEPSLFEDRDERLAFGDALPAGLRLTSTEGRGAEG